MIQTHAKFAPLDFINKQMKEKRRFLPKPNITFLKTIQRTIGTIGHCYKNNDQLIPPKRGPVLRSENSVLSSTQ